MLALIVGAMLPVGCTTRSPEGAATAKCEIVPVAGTPAVREVCGEGSAYRIRTWYPVVITPPPIYGLPGADSDPRPPKVVVVTK